MIIIKEKIRENFIRDTYWTRIHFESEDRKQKSTVLTCVSWEYILDTNRIHANELRGSHLDQWLGVVIKKWESFGDRIFSSKIHYDVYANTEEGKKNGLEFLQKNKIVGMEITGDGEEHCKKLIKRWEELEAKLPVAQRIIPGEPIKAYYISPDDLEELNVVAKEIKDKCLGFLSIDQKYEIERRLK